jgi:cysteinyl-tRNA synthetase
VRLYNTLTHKIEEFRPIKEPNVGIYSCGPTVYWNQHIGHMYAYVQWDILVRFLRYLGYKVTWVMNITDVGHMTSDCDSGEDKMEKGAKREGLSVWQIADRYIKQFLDSMDSLNINRPNVLCRATDHIQEQINLIKEIEKNGFTYKTKTGLVFDTSKFPGYANFAGLNLTKQNAGERVEVDPEKKQPWDFLLWVTNQPNHIMQWDSPWGRGFPGWHIECTAMSVKYLGERFDIHTGGKEHIPIHHTNEIAQGFGAFGHQTASFWLHNEWFTMKGEKISKSLGNMILVTDIIEKGFDPLALRYLIFSSHFRTGMDFTWDALKAAQNGLKNLQQIARNLLVTKVERESLSEEKLSKIDKTRLQFEDALENDLNVPEALAVTWSLLKSNIPARDKYDLLMHFDSVLGLRLDQLKLPEDAPVPKEIMELANKREQLRKERKWEEADQVRREILKKGYAIEDNPSGPKIIKI